MKKALSLVEWLRTPLVLSLLVTSFSFVLADSYDAPKLTTDFPKSYEFSNSTGGKLSCMANGNPTPTISWIFSDGSPVGNVHGLRHLSPDGTLSFPSFKAENYRQDVHSVSYRCSASNSLGTIVSNPVQVRGIVIQLYDIHVYDVYAMKDNSAIMKCHIPEFLEEYVSVTAWVKDSVIHIAPAEVHQESKYIVLSTGDLFIRNVSLDDDMTTFRCQTKHRLNRETKVSLTAGRLIVTEPKSKMPPKMSFVKDVMNVKEGSSIFLPCIVQGNPTPSCTWSMKKDEEKRVGFSSKRIAHLSGSLLIEHVQSSDSGVYICTAVNSVGTDRKAIQINVAEYLTIKALPKEAKVNAGEPITLTCEASSNLLIDMYWLRNGNSLPIEGIHQENNRTVHIPNMQSAYAGLYQCFASNFFQSVYSTALLLIGDSSPEIIQAFDEKILHPNEPLNLECVAKGSPKPEIIWTVNTLDIAGNNRVKVEFINIDHEQIKSILMIGNVRKEDGGVYSCIARNNAGKTYSHARINVYGEISADQKIKISATAEETVQIFCPFYGYPLKSILWKKGISQLPKDIKQAVFANGTLQIRHVNKRKDSGKYTCIVKNMEEKIFTSEVEIVILVPPKISPFSFQDEQIREGTRARIQCVVSEGEAPLVLKWLKDGRPIPSELGVTIRDLDEFSSILMITAITPRHNGNYSCVASNAAGQAQHSALLFVNVPPKILPFAFQDDQFFKGMRAYIVCALSQGDAPIHFTWLKDGKTLPLHLGVIIRNIDQHANSLSIESVSSQHTGNYTCVASNKAGKISHTAELLVHVVPRIVPFSFRDDMFEGSIARITCTVDQGDLPIRFHWMKDSSRVNSGNEGITIRTIDEYSSMLTIDNVNQKHSGNYSCLASNAASTVTYTAPLIVHVPPKIVPFSFQDESVLEGMLVRVSCVVSRGDLPLKISWIKDDLKIPSELLVTVRDFDEYSSVLSIDPVTRNHSGNYTCLVHNQAGSASYTSSLLVHVPPEWVIVPEDVSVTLNERILLHCQAKGFPQPHITWKKATGVLMDENFTPLVNNERVYIFSNGSLLFRQILKSDEGHYYCLANNDVGEPVSIIVFLKVKALPEFKLQYQELVSKKGDSVNILCQADGDLPITYKWIVNNVTIDSSLTSQRYKITDDRTSSQLSITWVDKKDSVIFVCEAENSIGKSEMSVKMIVQEPPEAPVLILPINVKDQTVHLRWNEPYDGNTPIQRYILQYRKKTDMWDKPIETLTIDGNKTEIIVGRLLPATTYYFHIMAENVLGNSSFSEEIMKTTGESFPSGAPENVQVESANDATLRVTWTPPQKNTWNGVIRGYMIGYKKSDSFNDYRYKKLEVPDDYHKDLIYQLTNLEKFTQYTVIVQAYNSVGKGPSSEPVIAITSESVPSAPPQKIRCSTLSSKSIYVLWEAPPMDSVNGILRGYKILYKPATEWYDAAQLSKNSDIPKFTVQDLDANTNYSIQVTAFTKVGDGVKSEPVFCKTLEDVPEPPMAIKVLPSSSDSVIVSWKPSKKSKSSITKYNVYFKALQNGEEIESESQMTEELVRDSKIHSSKGDIEFTELAGLQKNKKYVFWVTSNSAIGESSSSVIVAQTVADSIIPAKSASFDDVIKTPWKRDVIMPCIAVGIPAPQRKWMFEKEPLIENGHVRIRPDGAVVINKAMIEDSGNYICSVYNEHGRDETKYMLTVQVPPSAPKIDVISKTKSSLQLQWKTPMIGGDAIRGYLLHYKRENEPWTTKELRPEYGIYTIDELSCGATYQLFMESFNNVGTGEPSDIITVSTEGTNTELPSKNELIREGSTFATVHLDSWPSTGCPVQSFGIEYKALTAKEWTVVDSNISPSQKKMVISGLIPATWYMMRLIVDGVGGSDVLEYTFSTLTVSGETISSDVHESIKPMYIFYLDPLIFVPAVALLIVVIIAAVIVCVFMKRRPGSIASPSEFSLDTNPVNTWVRHSRNLPSDYGYFGRSSTLSRRISKDPCPYATTHMSHYYPEAASIINTAGTSEMNNSGTWKRNIPVHSGFPETSHRIEEMKSGTDETAFVFPSVSNFPFHFPRDQCSSADYDPPPKARMLRNTSPSHEESFEKSQLIRN